jgi:hypothetical protein
MQEIGFGSESLLRACQVAPACRAIEGRGPAAAWERFRAGSSVLSRLERSLPTVRVETTASLTGQMIREHFAIREGGRFRYRSAQAVLPLPTDFAQYMRGRSRQAVRTNVGHARRAGFYVTRTPDDDWEPGVGDSRRGLITPGPVERWKVPSLDGAVPRLAEAILTVDDDVALLHGLMSLTKHARWLLHTAIVEHLCGECRFLLVNSDDVYLLPPGHQYVQRLLGYEIARLDLPRPPRARIASRWSGSRYLTASRIVTPEARSVRGSSHS